MSLFDGIKRLFGRHKVEEYYDVHEEDDVPEVENLRRSEIDMSQRRMRERYITNLCDQMAECTREIEDASREYRYVTDYLKDCEVIDSIPEDSGNCLISAAENVINLLAESETHSGRLGKIDEASYQHMEALAADMPKALEDIKEHESYKDVVKEDLRRLEAEKVTRQFAVREARMKKNSCKNIVVIALFAMIFVMLILAILQFVFDMDVMPGFVLATAFGAIAITVCFTVFLNARLSERSARNQINQIVAKQNTVKIRYVNIQNLLSYEYEKYHVKSARELESRYKLYQDEKYERDLIRRTSLELDAAEERFRKELINMNVAYPTLWLHQAEAVVDRREMVELRHELVSRRQGLRKRIEFNTENRDIAKREVEELVRKYPNYAREILDIVSSYE